MLYMIDNWHDLKKLYLIALDNDPTIPVDEQWRQVQRNGRLWWHVTTVWKDGKSTGEYIPRCDTCEPKIVV